MSYKNFFSVMFVLLLAIQQLDNATDMFFLLNYWNEQAESIFKRINAEKPIKVVG